MAARVRSEGPVKAWIEPDRLVFARAFPGQMLFFMVAVIGNTALAYAVHPLFWGVVGFVLMRQASLEANLRELFREGMLHPARLLAERGSSGRLLATLVRLDGAEGAQDALVISRAPWRWKTATPWGGGRSAVVIAGELPRLKPLSPDVAGMDPGRSRAAVARIPELQWQALERALSQVDAQVEGLHFVELDREPWYGTHGIEPDAGMPPRLSQDDTSLWCAALPCIEEPEMVASERQRVVRLCRWAGYSLGLRFFSALAVVSAFAQLSVFVGATGSRQRMWASWLGLGLLVTAPVLLFLSIRSVRALRSLRRDLRAGRLLRFAGALSNYDSLALDPDLALLFRRALLRAEPGMHEELVVLPHSGQLLYAGKSWAPPGLTLSIKRVADPPGDAVKLALPREFEPQQADASVALARRRITRSEVLELSAHARALRRPGAAFWWVFGFAAVALGAWHGEDFRVPPSSIGVPIALLSSCVAAWSMVRRFRLALRLDNDVRLGWVLTVDPKSTQASELPVLGVETLLHAQLDWTINQRPVAWRRFGGLR